MLVQDETEQRQQRTQSSGRIAVDVKNRKRQQMTREQDAPDESHQPFARAGPGRRACRILGLMDREELQRDEPDVQRKPPPQPSLEESILVKRKRLARGDANEKHHRKTRDQRL